MASSIAMQSRPGSNDNEGVGTPHSSKLQNLSLTIRCYFVSYPWHSFGVFLPFRKDAVDVFNSPSRLGWEGLAKYTLCWDAV